MKFSELKPGELFEFDHSDLPKHIAMSMLKGPWHKITARKYLDPENGREYVVGTTSVKVVRVESMRENPKEKKSVGKAPTKKQVAARKLFAKRAKAGTLKKDKITPARRVRKSVSRKIATGVPVISTVENPSGYGREEIVQQVEILASILNKPLKLAVLGDGKYRVTTARGHTFSHTLTTGEMQIFMRGAIQAAIECDKR